jgi:hypothetical protein
MKTESLHIGMKVEHPHHGIGVVKAVSEQSADVLFDGGLRTVSPEVSHLLPAEPVITVNGTDAPLAHFIEQIIEETTHAVVRDLGLEKPESVVDQLGGRWHNGRMVLHPADPSLQPKEIPLETFFHKIVMIRNNLRVLEQKINTHEKLSDGDKVEIQQYISRCYGSMTTFNILFKEREDQFSSK